MSQPAATTEPMWKTAASRKASTWDCSVERWQEVAASPAFQRLKERICDLARPQASDCVVDLGAGTGLLALSLAREVESVTAVDSSRAMLEHLAQEARRSRLSNVRPVLADLRSLPLEDESATLIVSNYAFHHLDDSGKELALSEARRVLAPGGRLVVCDMMFSLSLRRRDVAIVASKVQLLLRRGPSGLLRLGRNALRIATRSWEQPAPADRWQSMLSRRHFTVAAIELLENEAGIAVARRPSRRGGQAADWPTADEGGLRRERMK